MNPGIRRPNTMKAGRPCPTNKRFSHLILTALWFACTANAAPSGEDQEWSYTLVFPMIWVTDINGKVDIGDNRIDVDTSFEDTLDSLHCLQLRA